MLVREKRDPLVRRLPIRMGIGVLIFKIDYSFIRLDSSDGGSVSLSASWGLEMRLQDKRNLLVQIGMRLLYRIVPPDRSGLTWENCHFRIRLNQDSCSNT